MLLTNLVPTAIVASAVAPALLLLWLAVAADSRPEPPRVVLTAVAFGAVAALVIGVVETVLTEIPVSAHPLLGTIETTLFFVAIPEETAKIAIIAWIALRSTRGGARACARRCVRSKRRSRLAIAPRRWPPWPKPSRR